MSMKGQPIRKSAGGVTYYDGQGEGIKRLYEFKFDYNAGLQARQDTRDLIRKAFKNDVFMMLSAAEMNSKQPPTATQIMIMDANNKTQIGPFIERQEDELLDPIVGFITARLIQRWWLYGLPEPPPEIMGQSYKVEYISLLAQAQRAAHTQALNEGIMFAGQVAQVKPEVLDNYNFDELAREHSDLIGMPARVMRSADEVQAVRQQRQQEMEQAKAMEMAAMATQGAKTLSETSTDPREPNALTSLLGGSEGAEGMLQ
jgi:hypothetical protein